jgi:hypothetical protein
MRGEQMPIVIVLLALIVFAIYGVPLLFWIFWPIGMLFVFIFESIAYVFRFLMGILAYWPWFLAGFVLLLVLLYRLERVNAPRPMIIHALPTDDQPSEKEIEQVDLARLESATRKCSDCLETIYLMARKCRFCGRDFDELEIANEVTLFAELEHKQKASAREAMLLADARSGKGLIDAIRKGSLPEISTMLSLGANPDKSYPPYGDYTPLEFAAGSGRPELVRRLLESGATVSASSDVFRYAIESDCPETIALLISYGANPWRKNKRGRTALKEALSKNHINPTIVTLIQNAPIVVICSNCKRTLKIPPQHSGKTGKCTHCGGGVKVPA